MSYFVAPRRWWLCIVTVVVALGGGLVRSAEAAPPNIVFLFTDDHAYQSISAYGSTINHTPNLDRLAKEGMLFRNCYVTNSICGPSRAVILTGKYSHLNGFHTNWGTERFNGEQQTFPKLLQAAGYQTAMIGKWHLVSDPTGFDYWNILPGQGDYYNPKMIELGKPTEVEGYCTDIVVDKSLEWLKKRDKSKPFLLMCQQKAPHRPWYPGPKYLNKYDDVTIPEPDTLFDDYSGRGKPAHTQDMTIAKTMNNVDLKFTPPPRLTPAQAKLWSEAYDAENEAFQKAKLQGQDLVRWKYQRYIKDYLRCIDSVDENIGRVLKFLDDEKLAENTIVVYSSDQGFYLGEHGWFDKRWIYEQSVKTPLIVRWPKVTKPGSVNESMVANLDFGATLLDAVGAKVPGDMQGRSFASLLKGQTPADWRTSLYYHYYEFPGPHAVRKHYGVVERRYKLVHFYEPDVNEWEMFDLQADPKELRSVYADPKYAKERTRLEAELKRLRAELKVPERDELKPPPGAAFGPGGKKAADEAAKKAGEKSPLNKDNRKAKPAK